MKKSLLVATILAVGSISGSASALNAAVVRDLQVDGFYRSLGVISVLPLGWNGPYCDYFANWYSPFNPNAVSTCLLHELRTAFNPSCIANEYCDITTLVQSDIGCCTGFNLKGEPLPATLFLSESVYGLTGVVTFSCPGIPQVYPVFTTIC